MKAALTIAAACVVCACAGTEPAQPKITTLSPEGARNRDFAYSRDGSRLAWMAPAAGEAAGWQLWTGKADMTGAVALPVTSLFNGTPPVWSPDGSMILQVSNNFGTASAVVIPAAGGVARRMTQGAGIQLPTDWNHDGDRFAYIATVGSSFSLFSASTKTGKALPLIPSETHPHTGSWSPDGSHLGYLVIEGARTTIWVADSAGKSPRQLTTEGFEQFSRNNAEWSPDGKEMLYESRRTGTSDIWVAPIDGGPKRQLTRDVRNDFDGKWSSDGKWIAFMSDRGRQTDVWVVPSAGGPEVRVTDTPEEESQPLWRPGTHELSFVTTTQKSSVWSHSIDDGKEVQLTPDSIRVTWFNVSPDGKMVNYTVNRGGGIEDLMVVPAGGGAPRTLVSGGGYFNSPRWSPDGSQIVFISDRGGTPDVWVVDAAGGAPRQLDNWPGVESTAVWSADGKSVLFVSDHDAKLGDVWKVAAAGGEPVRVTRNGTIGDMITRPGAAEVLVGIIGQRGGELGVARLGQDGVLHTVWDKSNILPQAISPSGKEFVALVEQADGKSPSMIMPMDGGAGRAILKANEQAVAWSSDGKWMLYMIGTAGVNDLAVLNLADGTTKRLTTTPQSELGAEWSPDGKTVFFTRRTTVQRIVTTDLAKILK